LGPQGVNRRMAYDPDQMNLEHQEIWQGFIKLTIYSTAFVVMVLILMGTFLL